MANKFEYRVTDKSSPAGRGNVILKEKNGNFPEQAVTPNSGSETASVILPSTRSVVVGAVTSGVTDFIVLPSLADVETVHSIKIACNAGGAFEMRTPATSGELINTVDSDGTQEYLCTDTEVITVTKVSDADGWVATAQTALGAIATAVIPD